MGESALERCERLGLAPGVKVFYGGDMANREDWGTVTAINSDRWGACVVVAWDSGRQSSLSVALFSPEYLGHGGTRFVTQAAYRLWREAQLSSLRRALPNLPFMP